jgi:hypothetical protein
MDSSIIHDDKYQELKISFSFDEKHEKKLAISALVDKDSYSLELNFNPDFDFEDLKSALLSKQFKLS